MLFDDYEPPLDDKLLYYFAYGIDTHGRDPDDLVQEARIKMWQLWQEQQWVRTSTPKPKAWYVTAVKRRMLQVYLRKSPPFGTAARPGYSDAMNRDCTGITERQERLPIETPFELLDEFPAELVAG